MKKHFKNFFVTIITIGIFKLASSFLQLQFYSTIFNYNHTRSLICMFVLGLLKEEISQECMHGFHDKKRSIKLY